MQFDWLIHIIFFFSSMCSIDTFSMDLNSFLFLPKRKKAILLYWQKFCSTFHKKQCDKKIKFKIFSFSFYFIQNFVRVCVVLRTCVVYACVFVWMNECVCVWMSNCKGVGVWKLNKIEIKCNINCYKIVIRKCRKQILRVNKSKTKWRFYHKILIINLAY